MLLLMLKKQNKKSLFGSQRDNRSLVPREVMSIGFQNQKKSLTFVLGSQIFLDFQFFFGIMKEMGVTLDLIEGIRNPR